MADLQTGLYMYGRSIQLFYDYFLCTGRFQAAAVAFDGRIWTVGGCESWNPLNSLEIYDPSSDTWSIGPALNTPRRGCGLAVRKGKRQKTKENQFDRTNASGQLMVVGGTDGTQSMCTTEILDLVENTWHPGPTVNYLEFPFKRLGGIT